MKKVIVILFCLAVAVSCGGGNHNRTTEQSVHETDSSIVNVYYFHGKQRCKTCVAVGDVAKSAIEQGYAGNTKVRFTEINTSEEGRMALVEKYKVTWNALIIDRNGNPTDITKQAFATAIHAPDSLTQLICRQVDKRLQEL